MRRPAQAMRPTQPSSANRTDRKDDQRHSHRLRRLMHMMFDLVAHARWTIESKVHQPEHVERRHQRGSITDKPEDAIGAAFRSPRLPQDFVFREKTGKRKYSSNR